MNNAILAETLNIEPLGDQALILRFSEVFSIEINQQVHDVAKLIKESSLSGLLEVVPAYTTLTVFYNPLAFDVSPYDEVLSLIKNLLSQNLLASEKSPSQVVELPVCYEGVMAPDIEEVAQRLMLSVEEVISLHSSSLYQVCFLGFAPGFPFLSGLPEAWNIPRKETPRQVVAAGSVGLAGKQTGVYPLETPGGWQIIGRCPIPLWRPNESPPVIFQPGDSVRFKPVSEEEFSALQRGELCR